MITQTVALFVDAYRELNSKKLFWFVLFISGLFVASFACVGINENGLTILWWELPIPVLNTRLMSKSMFYSLMFFTVGFKLWLTWAATVLAIISTAGIMPDFVSGGAVELTLSKPIGRLRLFLTKYLTGLLFVGLQVALFTLASFIVIGVRAGSWEWNLFWAVPLVVAFFSYLYSFCAVVGLWTRSTIAAVLLTILLWFTIFLLHTAETGLLLQFKVRQDQIVALQQQRLEESRSKLEEAKAARPEAPADGPSAQADPAEEPSKEDARREARIARLEEAASDWERKLRASEGTQRKLDFAHEIVFATKTVLPKTTETMDLLSRVIVKNTELEHYQDQALAQQPGFSSTEDVDGVQVSPRSVEREMRRIINERTVWWVLGTSLLFEASLLGLGALMFCTRDF